MFDKFKQFNELRQLQKELNKQQYTAEKGGITVVVNGSMQVEEIVLNPERKPEDQQYDVKFAINEAMAKAQKGAAEKMKGMGLGM